MSSFNMYRIFYVYILNILVPESRCGSAPRSPRTYSDIVLLVNVLQKLDIDSLVSPLGISKIAKILSQKRVINTLLCNISMKLLLLIIVCQYSLCIHISACSCWDYENNLNQCDCLQLVRLLRTWGELTLLVAQNCLCPSLISGLNFCSRAFCTLQMGGGSRPVCRASCSQAHDTQVSLCNLEATEGLDLHLY